jgi:hypothetical protein
MLKAALFRVFELAGNEIDHIPSVMVSTFLCTDDDRLLLCNITYSYITKSLILSGLQYDFDINNAKKPDDRDEVYSRVSNMPALINLGS